MEQPLPQCLSTNSVPRAFFPRVAIGCRLPLKINRKIYGIWINIYRSVGTTACEVTRSVRRVEVLPGINDNQSTSTSLRFTDVQTIT